MGSIWNIGVKVGETCGCQQAVNAEEAAVTVTSSGDAANVTGAPELVFEEGLGPSSPKLLWPLPDPLPPHLVPRKVCQMNYISTFLSSSPVHFEDHFLSTVSN